MMQGQIFSIAGGEKRAGGWTWSYSVVARGAGRQHEAGEKEKQAH